MKIKTIFRICAALIFIQGIPLFLSLFSSEFKLMLIADAFGANPSADAVPSTSKNLALSTNIEDVEVVMSDIILLLGRFEVQLNLLLLKYFYPQFLYHAFV